MEPVRLFPELYSNSDFIADRDWTNDLHPSTMEYDNFWLSREAKMYEGLWGNDSKILEDGTKVGGFRYMPPSLYCYINYGIIEDEAEGNTAESVFPNLRDVDWIIHTDYNAARGMSGWVDAPFTCHRLVGKKHEGKPLSKREEIQFKLAKHIYDASGKLKPYVDIIDALHKTHENTYGKPVYENEAKDYMLLGSRGSGKSFSIAGIILHEWITGGVKEFDITRKPPKIEIMYSAPDRDKLGGLASKIKGMFNNILLEVGSYEESEDGNTTFYPGYFHQAYTGNITSIDSKIVAQYQEKLGKQWVTRGSQSILSNHVLTTENPEKAASKRTNLFIVDEVGLVSNILDVLAAAKNSMIRKTKFGTAFLTGTSGNMDKVLGSQRLFEQADAYNILSFKDVFEGRPVNIGRFLPAYYASETFRDEMGNTNIADCFESLMEERDRIAKTGNTASLEKELMNRPIVPSEMFLTKSGNKLPVALLRKRHVTLKVDEPQKAIESVGMLYYTNKNRSMVRWGNDNELIPIRTYNIDEYKGNLKGAIVIYEHPPDELPEAKFHNNLYKITYDPVKDDNWGTSLASVIVYKGIPNKMWEVGLSDTIVAEYIGRLDKVNDMHEIAFKLACYYNAKILPETNIPDIVRYAEMTKRYSTLQPALTVAIGKILLNPSFKYSVGIDMSSVKVQEQGTQLLAQWLLKERNINENGEATATNIDYLYTQRGIEEMIASGQPGNYDYFRCLQILALWLSQEEEGYIDEPKVNEVFKELNAYFKTKKNYGYQSFR